MLRKAGIARIVMVTGDRAATAETIGAALDLDCVLADRVPLDKVDAVRAELGLHPTTMIGDGIKDARLGAHSYRAGRRYLRRTHGGVAVK